MKNKKLLKTIASLAVGTLMAGSVAFAACDNTPANSEDDNPSGTQHTHHYGEWKPNEDAASGHYKVCTDDDCTAADKGKQTEEHHIEDGECKDCHYKPSASTTVSVTGVTLNKTELSLKEGADETLKATVAPENATNKAVSWSSDHPEYATVDGNGKVTAVAEGTAVITVTTTDGGFTATCTVTVTKEATPPSGELKYTLLKVDDVTLEDGSTLSADLSALGITVASFGKTAAVSPEPEKAYTSAFNGETISATKYISTQGGIKGNIGIKVEAKEDLVIYVYAYNTGSDERYLALYDNADNNSSFVAETNQSVGNNTCSALSAVKFEVKSGETKYIGSTGSSVLFYAIGVVTGGNVTETTASSVEATAATCEEAGNQAYTVSNYGRYYLSGSNTAVSYLGVVTNPLGHDYTGVSAVKVKDPTETEIGEYTATCTRNSGHVHTIELPVLKDRSYDRTATGAGEGNYMYTYLDETTGCTIKFEAVKVEAEAGNYQSWELDFTSSPLKPSSNTSLTAGQIIENVLTVTATGGGNLNSAGYLKVGNGGVLTFKVEETATFTIKFNNSNSSRNMSISIGGTPVGDAITVDGKEHTVTLSKGTCTLTFAGGDIQISKMSLTYGSV